MFFFFRVYYESDRKWIYARGWEDGLQATGDVGVSVGWKVRCMTLTLTNRTQLGTIQHSNSALLRNVGVWAGDEGFYMRVRLGTVSLMEDWSQPGWTDTLSRSTEVSESQVSQKKKKEGSRTVDITLKGPYDLELETP